MRNRTEPINTAVPWGVNRAYNEKRAVVTTGSGYRIEHLQEARTLVSRLSRLAPPGSRPSPTNLLQIHPLPSPRPPPRRQTLHNQPPIGRRLQNLHRQVLLTRMINIHDPDPIRLIIPRQRRVRDRNRSDNHPGCASLRGGGCFFRVVVGVGGTAPEEEEFGVDAVDAGGEDEGGEEEGGEDRGDDYAGFGHCGGVGSV